MNVLTQQDISYVARTSIARLRFCSPEFYVEKNLWFKNCLMVVYVNLNPSNINNVFLIVSNIHSTVTFDSIQEEYTDSYTDRDQSIKVLDSTVLHTYQYSILGNE